MTSLAEPKCYTRKCKWFIGVETSDRLTPYLVCKAFPKGIPHEIAYGENQHNAVIDSQAGEYVFEEA